MVHPAVVAAFAVTGVLLVSWKIYEEYQERKMYEQYQRHRARFEQENNYEQQYNRFHRNNNDFDFDDDREESTSSIRKRKPFSDTSSTEKKKSVEEEEQEQFELSDLESSIAERKRRLMAEQAFLDQEEESLRNRRNTIMRNSTEVSPLSNSRSIISNNSSSINDSSDSEDDEHTSQSHKANFDPFVDQFQENSSSDRTSVKHNDTESSLHEGSNSDSTETINIEINQASLNNSSELFYPSASQLSPSTSTATSISGENINSPNMNRGSDSEESWDAVSEVEWNQSSANESDNELSSHFSVASISDDDARIRF